MYQIKAGGGRKHIPQKNNPNLGKETRRPKAPKWTGVVRRFEKIARKEHEVERERRGSQTRLGRLKKS